MPAKGKALILAKEGKKAAGISKKRTLTEPDAVPASKVSKMSAEIVPKPAPTLSKAGKKKVGPKDVVDKLEEVIMQTKSIVEKDEAYNKLKLEEVKHFLETMTRPNILKAVPEIMLTTEDAPSILNLLLDGLGEILKHGNKMVFAVTKTIVKSLSENRETMEKEKIAGIMAVINVHCQCQLTIRQYRSIMEQMFILMM